MAIIKGTIKVIEPTKQYGNYQPEITIEKPVEYDLETEAKELQDLMHSLLAHQQELINPESSTDNEKFVSLPPDVKRLFKKLVIDYCERRNWGVTKIKKDIMTLLKEPLSEGLAESIYKGE